MNIRTALLYLLLFSAWCDNLNAQSGITGTRHNLSSSGPGSFTATSEQEVCIFCHTPHQGSAVTPPLWNRNLSGAGYIPYSSSSMNVAPGQPTGYSKLCLSCHDGTIALGSILAKNGSPALVNGLETPLSGTPAVIGTNMSNDHPVSFSFDAALFANDGELIDPASLTGAIHLWAGDTPTKDNIQCSSCHDAHEDRSPKFLRKLLMGQTDNLCLTCHDKTEWHISTHGTSNIFFPSGQAQTTVSDYSCRACHHPHSELGTVRLLDNGISAGLPAIEETCYKCHQSAGSGGIVADLKTIFTTSLSIHPVADYQGHNPIFINIPSQGLPEGVLLSPNQPSPNPTFTDTKHVECTDCHNPHRVMASNRTNGIRGIDINGQEIDNVINDPELPDGNQKQYQLCLRCHGDTYDQFIPPQFWNSSQLRTVIGEPASSFTSGSNKRIEFDFNDPTNTGFHPVAGIGRNQSAAMNAQLAFAGLSSTSILKCTDCHNSEMTGSTNGRASNATSAVTGPHGSIYGRILRQNYFSGNPPFTPPMSEPFGFSSNNFGLCFLCHNVLAFTDRNESTMTNFYSNDRDNLHYLHLTNVDGRNGLGNAICAECHYNPHSNRESANTTYEPPADGDTHLINFSPSVTGANLAQPFWMYNPPLTSRFGRQSPDRPTMSCNLTCHDVSHDRVDQFFYEWRES